MSCTYLDQLYRFGRGISGDDYPNICLAVAQGTLLWQPVNLGDVRRLCTEGPLLFASVFDNGYSSRKSAFKIFNGNNQTTSFPNLVS